MERAEQRREEKERDLNSNDETETSPANATDIIKNECHIYSKELLLVRPKYTTLLLSSRPALPCLCSNSLTQHPVSSLKSLSPNLMTKLLSTYLPY
jgi:hypothetical protein